MCNHCQAVGRREIAEMWRELLLIKSLHSLQLTSDDNIHNLDYFYEKPFWFIYLFYLWTLKEYK